MPNGFKHAKIQTLQDTQDCKTFEQLNQVLGDEKNQMIAQFPYAKYLKKNTPSFIESFTSALMYAQLPIQVLWLIVAFVSLGAAGLWIFGGVGLFAGILLVGYSVRYLKKQHHKMVQDQHDLIFMGIKNEALDELIQRQDPSIKYSHVLSEDFTIDKKEILEWSSFFSLNLLFTFWGTRDLMVAVGLISAAAFIAGPFGLAIAAGVTLLVGIGYAAYHYQFLKKNAPMESIKKSLEEQIKEKEVILQTLQQVKKPEVTQTISPPEVKEENRVQYQPVHSSQEWIRTPTLSLGNGKQNFFKPSEENNEVAEVRCRTSHAVTSGEILLDASYKRTGMTKT
jgi:hypothetical protein